MFDLIEPTLLLDEEKCLKNIAKMADKASAGNLILRPHFKTHQSRKIGEWYRKAGVDRITVSSMKMAEYFAVDKWKDITVAVPLNIRETERINGIPVETVLNLMVESPESIELAAGKIIRDLNFFIEIDCGYRRTGVDASDYKTIDNILQMAAKFPRFHFTGFLTHAGNSYKSVSDRDHILSVHRQSIDCLVTLKEKYSSGDFTPLLSAGDTPTFSVAEDFGGIDEARPGNMVFYDLAQQRIGSCELNEIAIAMACPVISKYPERNQIVVYGGGVHFSKDFSFLPGGEKHFGKVVTHNEKGWNTTETGMYVKALSHEHGIIHAPAEATANLNIGDILYILPVHACLTADCMKSYLTLSGERISRL